MTFWWRRWIEHSRSPRWTSVAVVIAEDLDLDVARPLEVLLDVDVVVAEGAAASALRRLERGAGLRRRGRSHAAAAAAGRRLDDHREADPGRDAAQLSTVLMVGAVAAGEDRHAGLGSSPPGR
jgi:hypothetical protein